MLSLMLNGLEATLTDSNKTYHEKVNALLSAWEQVTDDIVKSPEKVQSLVEWAHEHTLKVVLRGEWPKLSPDTKSLLNQTLERCASIIGHHPAAKRFTPLIELVQNPWARPGLDKILNGQLNSEHEEEEFCFSEAGELLTMRLKVLCEDHCEDIAVNLAAACLRSLRRSERLRSVTDQQQIQYMTDVYIVLLCKFKKYKQAVAHLEDMSFKDSLELLQRLIGERPTKYGLARVWRNSNVNKAADLVAQYLVTAGMVKPIAELTSTILEEILDSWASTWKSLHSKETATLEKTIRDLVVKAESAQNIYIFCGALIKHFRDSIKHLIIELYIKALTTDMNELENQKTKSDTGKLEETEKRLSEEFLKLADFVEEFPSIARECVLTSFSLNPTRPCYERIRDFAKSCGKCGIVKEETLIVDVNSGKAIEQNDRNNDQNKSETEVVCDKEQEISVQKKVNETKIEIEKNLGAVVLRKDETVKASTLSTHHLADDETLGPQLRDDLAVVLSSQRYRLLNWSMNWKEMSELCEKYLENTEGMRNSKKELKYLNIDYSQFKDHQYNGDPTDFFGIGGIEKGYEHLADSSSEDYESDLSPSDDKSSDSNNSVVMKFKRKQKTKVKNYKDYSSDSSVEIRPRKKPKGKVKVKVILSSDSEANNPRINRENIIRNNGINLLNIKKLKRPRTIKRLTKPREKHGRLTLEALSHFQLLINENIRSGTGMDNNSGGIQLLRVVPADTNKNKSETIKCETVNSETYNPASLFCNEKRKADPKVLKSLGLFLPANNKNSFGNSRNGGIISELKRNNLNEYTSSEEVDENQRVNNKTYEPLLGTLDLNPKIVLKRDHDADAKLLGQGIKKRRRKSVTPKELNTQLKKIQKTIPYRAKNFNKTPSPRKDINSDKFDSKIDSLANSFEFSVVPAVRPTVNVVQLTRNIAQIPNSASSNPSNITGSTPPRDANRGPSQVSGTPSLVAGHDSGVGMSPTSQTTPSTNACTTALQDNVEEASQPVINQETESTPALFLVTNRHVSPNQISSEKSTTTAGNGTKDQVIIGSYPIVSGQQGILSLQNIKETNNVNLSQQSSAQESKGLPKFHQAFGKSICNLSQESISDGPESSESSQQTSNNNNNQRQAVTKTLNVSKGVQASTQTSVQTIARVPIGRYFVKTGNTNQINIKSGVLLNVQNSLQKPLRLQVIGPGQPLTPNTIQLATTRIQPQQQSSQQQTVAAKTEPIINQPIETPTNETTRQQLDLQLEEFESVMKNVEEKGSSTSQTTSTESNTVQMKTIQSSTIKQSAQLQIASSALAQQLLTNTIQARSNNTVDFQSSHITLQQQPQQEFLSSTPKVAVAYVNQINQIPLQGTAKLVSSTPLVVVTSYCQPAASPALSVTSQSSSSPCVTPAPTTPIPSTGKSSPSKSSKKSSSKSVKSSASTTPSSNNASKSSPIPKPQQKPQEDEQTTQRIYQILTQYAEQLRNSPDLNNKPAPRRRSNPPTNPSQSSAKRKKSSGSSKSKSSSSSSSQQNNVSEASPSSEDPGHTMASSEDSCGASTSLMNLQDNSEPGFSASEETMHDSITNTNSDDGMHCDLIEETSSAPVSLSSTAISSVQQQNQTQQIQFQQQQQPRTVVIQEDSNYLVLPMNIVKPPLVLSGAKIMELRSATGAKTGQNVQNTFVLQSLLQTTGGPVRQLKIPGLQGLSGGQGTTVVIPQGTNILGLEKNQNIKSAETTIILNKSGQACSQTARLLTATTAGGKTQSVVCLMPDKAAQISNLGDQKIVIQRNNDLKDSGAEKSEEKIIIAKAIKRKFDGMRREPITIICANSRTNLQQFHQTDALKAESSEVKNISNKQNLTTLAPTTATTTILDSTGTFLIGNSGPASIDSQEGSNSPNVQNLAIENIDNSSNKIENGVICGNARLHEAWDADQKGSPDAPWSKYASTNNPLGEHLNSSMNNTILQAVNKSQVQTELSSGQTLQGRKNYSNLSMETFNKFSGRNTIKSGLQQLQSGHSDLHMRMHLPKSLSEECEDLGVDEPCPKDLFPEADLPFDTNHSPSFDHSSQEASSSNQPITSLKFSNNLSYFGSDSVSSESKDESPPTSQIETKSNEKKKPAVKRSYKAKEVNNKRLKKITADDIQHHISVKQMKLTADSSSQDEASNSTSDLSRLSPATAEIDLSKEVAPKKMTNKSILKDYIDSSSSISSNRSNVVKLDLELDALPVHIISAANEKKENVELSGIPNNIIGIDNTTVLPTQSPVSVSLPNVPQQKFNTHINTRKRAVHKSVRSTDYTSWESPASEKMKSSSENEDDDENLHRDHFIDDEDDIDEDVLNDNKDNFSNLQNSNGLQDGLRTLPSVHITPLDHSAYTTKEKSKEILPTLLRKPVGTLTSVTKKFKALESVKSDTTITNLNKSQDGSDEERTNSATFKSYCSKARRASSRSNIKKGCTCCLNGPERSKPKKPVDNTNNTSKPHHVDNAKMKKRIIVKPLNKKR